MILWVDDVRPAPNDEDFAHIHSVNMAVFTILLWEKKGVLIDYIDLDHDAGDYEYDGGDYIKLLDWLEATGRNYPIRVHSMNPIGRGNMRRIIRKNGWKEIE